MVDQKVIRQLIQTEKIFSIYLFVTSVLSPERHSINENNNKIEWLDRNTATTGYFVVFSTINRLTLRSSTRFFMAYAGTS